MHGARLFQLLHLEQTMTICDTLEATIAPARV